mmetsp:Transcript_139632/g.348203  ORF Transcript_139632/g.348203 Transcript_139632/m.348203 type:complete len:214 (-) Transcript_139632:321-962(-)
MASFAMPITASPSRRRCRSTPFAAKTSLLSSATSSDRRASRIRCSAVVCLSASAAPAARAACVSTQTARTLAASTMPRPRQSCACEVSAEAAASMIKPGRRGPKAYPKMLRMVISIPEANVLISWGTTSMLIPHKAGTIALCAPQIKKTDANSSHIQWSPQGPRYPSSLERSLPYRQTMPETPARAETMLKLRTSSSDESTPGGRLKPPRRST